MHIIDVFTKLLNSLECPVCYEYVSSPIFQCNAGHILCNKCKSSVFDCPTCRTKFPGSCRARMLEEISDYMIFPCRNDGCDQLLPLEELKVHEDTCSHANVNRGNSEENDRLTNLHQTLLLHIEQHIVPFIGKTAINSSSQTDATAMKTISTSTDIPPAISSGSFLLCGLMHPLPPLGEKPAAGDESPVEGVFTALRAFATTSNITNNYEPLKTHVLESEDMKKSFQGMLAEMKLCDNNAPTNLNIKTSKSNKPLQINIGKNNLILPQNICKTKSGDKPFVLSATQKNEASSMETCSTENLNENECSSKSPKILNYTSENIEADKHVALFSKNEEPQVSRLIPTKKFGRRLKNQNSLQPKPSGHSTILPGPQQVLQSNSSDLPGQGFDFSEFGSELCSRRVRNFTFTNRICKDEFVFHSDGATGLNAEESSNGVVNQNPNSGGENQASNNLFHFGDIIFDECAHNFCEKAHVVFTNMTRK